MIDLKPPPGRMVWWHLQYKSHLYYKRAMTAFDAVALSGLQLHQVAVLGWSDENPLSDITKPQKP